MNNLEEVFCLHELYPSKAMVQKRDCLSCEYNVCQDYFPIVPYRVEAEQFLIQKNIYSRRID